MNMTPSWRLIIVTPAVISLATLGTTVADAQDLEQLERQFITSYDASDYARATRLAEQLLAAARRQMPDDPEVMAYAWYYLGAARRALGQYVEAEEPLKQAIAIAQRAFGNTEDVAEVLVELGATYSESGRFEEADAMLRQALGIFRRARNNEGIVNAQYALAYLYMQQGRYAEADVLFKQALELGERVLGRDDAALGYVLDSLVDLYLYQGRVDAAEPLAERSYDIRRQAVGPDHIEYAASLWSRAWVNDEQERYVDAEALYKQALAIANKRLGQHHRYTAELRFDLAHMYQKIGRTEDAEPLYKSCLESVNVTLGEENFPQTVWAYNALASLYLDQGKRDEARELLNKGVQLGALGASYAQRYLTHLFRARLNWQEDNRTAAVADLREAMKLAEQQRGRASGAEHQRARFFAEFSEAFEKMVAWQLLVGNHDAALDAMERSRARSLLDQMAVQGYDLLLGVDQETANRLRAGQRAARERVGRLEAQLRGQGAKTDVTPEQRKAQSEKINGELVEARRQFVQARADVRNASPVYQRLAVGQDKKPITLANLQGWLAERDGLLPEYMIGEGGSYLLVVPPDEPPKLVELKLNEEQARKLGGAAGSVNAERLAEMLTTQQKSGVVDRLKLATDPQQVEEVVPGLAALWQALIPEDERRALVAMKYERLFVIPDGPLSMLPFETLVTDEKPTEPSYLIDVGPAVQYAPSATILHNLTPQERKQLSRLEKPVLSVADPAYSGSSATTSRGYSIGARYGTAGGQLDRLLFSSWETAWIDQVFGKEGIQVEQLTRGQATEQNVRRLVAGRAVVHLACHGIADQAHGNLFGALALAPGGSGTTADDGFLTLGEIYALDLNDCELAILSACDTNFGPHQRGEGVWAVSRGFLVAGSRRVIASNWLVDDEAAASLMSVYCGHVAQADSQDSVDYATALHKAKKWVKNNEKWGSPYYWGTFVLVGPN